MGHCQSTGHHREPGRLRVAVSRGQLCDAIVGWSGFVSTCRGSAAANSFHVSSCTSKPGPIERGHGREGPIRVPSRLARHCEATHDRRPTGQEPGRG
jgi:hypothetical protein